MDTISQNVLKAIRFERPEYIPAVFSINPACWHHYHPDDLLELMAEHRILSSCVVRRASAVRRPVECDKLNAIRNTQYEVRNTSGELITQIAPWERAGVPYTDAWGCVWETTDDGITGTVTGHPLADWDAFEHFTAPNPAKTNGMGEIDWPAIKDGILKARLEGKYCVDSLEHGHAFQRLSYLRGFENLLFDMADRDDRLWRLIEMVETFSIGIVERYLELGAEMICYPEDLGMQVGPMISPEHFRTYIKPIYEHLMSPAHKAARLVHMHSDGDIRDLANELIGSGVDALNLQDLVNGIDWIAANLKGRICIDIDIDRQKITRFGSPEQIDNLIHQEVQKLGSPEGGLMMIYGLYPGVPLENVKAIMDAMERYAGFYA